MIKVFCFILRLYIDVDIARLKKYFMPNIIRNMFQYHSESVMIYSQLKIMDDYYC